jgi:hypothetical protein
MRKARPTSYRDADRLQWTVSLVLGAQMIGLLAVSSLHWGAHSTWIWAQPTDLAFFRDGARVWLEGGNPYQINGFVTPPPSLLFSSLLVPVARPMADWLFLATNVALLAWSLRRYAVAVGLARREQVFFLLASSIFFSTQESAREGNLDVLMLALLVLTFTLSGAGGALALGASIGTKAYSILFLPVMLRFRQWRRCGIAVLALCLLMLPFYRLWSPAYHSLMFRSGRFWSLSIAPASLVYPLLGGDAKVESLAALLLNEFLAVTFVVALVRDRSGKLTPQTLARYAPWMLAAPSLVFSYVGVQALPVLAVLMGAARRRKLQRAEWCIFLGFLLLGIHAERLAGALPLAQNTFQFWRTHAAMVQALGVVLMIVGTCFVNTAEDAHDGEGFRPIAEA